MDRMGQRGGERRSARRSADLLDDMLDSRGLASYGDPVLSLDDFDGVLTEEEEEALGIGAQSGLGGARRTGKRTGPAQHGLDQDITKSAGDQDMDFAVLELDSSHLNVDVNKHKTSLRKKGSLALRKKPTRANVPFSSQPPDNGLLDTRESNPVTSSARDSAREISYNQSTSTIQDPPTTLGPPSLQVPPTTEALDGTETRDNDNGTKRTGQAGKPPTMMVGLQDLSKSRLFQKERLKAGEKAGKGMALSSTSMPSLPTRPSAAGSSAITSAMGARSARRGYGSGQAAGPTNPGTDGVTNGEWAPVLGVHDSGRWKVDGTGEGGRTSLSRTGSWSSVSNSPRRLSQDDGGGGGGSGGDMASNAGSYYSPLSFRPGQDSSSLHSDPPSDSSSSPPPTRTDGVSQHARSSSGLKATSSFSSSYKRPVWLSEMKAKSGAVAGRLQASRRHTTTVTPGDSGAVPSARTRRVEETASWVRVAQEKTSRVAEKLQAEKERQENGETTADQQPVSPWTAQLRTTSRSSVVDREHSGQGPASVTKHTSNGASTDSSVANTGALDPRQYSPSWMKTGGQTKTSLRPPSTAGDSEKQTTAVISGGGLGAATGVRTTGQETPRWKLQLAEKKRHRQTETTKTTEATTSKQESSMGGADSTTNPAGTAASTSPSGNQWRQQLRTRHAPPTAGEGMESPAGIAESTSPNVSQWRQQLRTRHITPTSGRGQRLGNTSSSSSSSNSSSPSPDWARQAEERRARLFKSGLLDQSTAG